ncbi:uncharacterized protein LOC129582045 isoform X2 [Paramacrobiotus metropolitanus]|uniref:uncharacterized protein LOC129582045 isoform X2 n=1 Tax=Paramacrobiotus metropolitanus TaxID=2943436 RepID=UPI0024465A52|nr:uncharacterized protein LOC129582045 isoform X2 [Paramacrobiotus metropolitanus]
MAEIEDSRLTKMRLRAFMDECSALEIGHDKTLDILIKSKSDATFDFNAALQALKLEIPIWSEEEKELFHRYVCRYGDKFFMFRKQFPRFCYGDLVRQYNLHYKAQSESPERRYPRRKPTRMSLSDLESGKHRSRSVKRKEVSAKAVITPQPPVRDDQPGSVQPTFGAVNETQVTGAANDEVVCSPRQATPAAEAGDSI